MLTICQVLCHAQGNQFHNNSPVFQRNHSLESNTTNCTAVKVKINSENYGTKEEWYLTWPGFGKEFMQKVMVKITLKKS